MEDQTKTLVELLGVETYNAIIDAIYAAIDSGKAKATEEIIPAEPLREMPKNGTIIFFAHSNTVKKGNFYSWHSEDIYAFEAGRVFPDTPEGKAGAEKRSKAGILPPIDREELRKRYKKWQNTDGEAETPTVDFLIYIKSILEGGSDA